MATAQGLIDQALKLAGIPSLSANDALDWLNTFLQSEYRRKYSWQRTTITLAVTAGTTSYPGAWDASFLDTYQQRDGSTGRYAVDTSVRRLWEMDYREYIALPARLSGSGPPQRIVADQVGATWYVYPVPDGAYSLTVDIYHLPPLVALDATPLWSAYAPEEILVQAVKVAALFYLDDERYAGEKSILFGDNAKQIPGMLPTYRRRVAADEGTAHPSALDPRVFLPMAMQD